MLDVDGILRPWWDRMRADLGDPALFDAHTHVGDSDPDGARQTPEQLLAALEPVDARAVVFAMHEPDGYPAANDRVLAAAADSGGRLVAFCRLDPRADPLTEARRCLDAGAKGIKLHPRAERFTLSEPAVRDIVALAHERRVPVLIHAGRGIPALGQDTVRLSGEFTDARLILAHAAISDLAWLWRVLPEHPNLFVDTAWWDPADMLAMFTLCPPGNLLWASDSPYGRPLVSAVLHLRFALQAGLGDRGDPHDRRRPARAAARRRRAARRRAAAGRARRRSTRWSSASSRTSTRRSRGRSTTATPRSRSRSRASRARWGRTGRTPS